MAATPPTGPAGLAEVVLELYELAPEQFTARRDEVAAQAGAAGDKALAAAVRKLRRPTTSAWALNLLSRREGDLLGELLRLGESLRDAQAGLDGATVRELDEQRRRVVSALAVRAGKLAEEHGHPLDAEMSRQVEQSLAAALADPDAGSAVGSGQLTKPVSVVGFGVVVDPDAVAVRNLVLVPALGSTGSRTSRGRRPAAEKSRAERETVEKPDALTAARQRRDRERDERLAEARERLTQAREVEQDAERAAAAAAAGVAALRDRRDERQQERDELADRLAACEADLSELTARLRDREQEQEAADEALRRARRSTRQAERHAERS
jgi:hypothetical protein